MSVLITVGTTRFDDLIRTVDSTQFKELMKNLGYLEIICQIGTGQYVPKLSNFRIVPSLISFIQDADLVISHGGAGTILECLRMKKKLIVVINDQLMGNHQLELAKELSLKGHLLLCPSPQDLPSIVSQIPSFHPTQMPESNRAGFIKIIHSLV